MRNNLTKRDGGFIRKTNINKIGEGIIFTSNKDIFRKLILEKFKSEEFKTNTDFAKIIAWRNKTIMSANKIIRDELFGKNSDIIELGDILMGYRSVRSSNNRHNIIDNSADYRVVGKTELQENKYHIKGYLVKLREDLAHGRFKFKEVFIIDSNDYENLHKYAELHDHYRDIGKQTKEIGSWKKYYEFRKNNVLMKSIFKHKNGFDRNKHDIINKDIDYGFAITGHKSQSSTYTHVGIILDDIEMNPITKEKNQILYVGLTRPTTSAIVLTNDDEL